ncbi:flagellar assembly protein FliH [Rhodopirellula sp. JC740]|uniref:Flagellar assembly protein FliH n=1 Tax=Rhodopirellula halodulae TaxID=2894198 RepID=A0ABS8NP57_9BACT|nr:flagellar assembly protein FliH [Rhodopirellula sp. JC740]MCC9645320.1 flagellar assembly protein FliH [Rhodopirellula sp. JC740]
MASILKFNSGGDSKKSADLAALAKDDSLPPTQAGKSTRVPAEQVDRATGGDSSTGDVVGKKPGGLSGLADFNLSDLAEKGREELRQAREQARQLLADAEKQAAEMKQAAEARGYEDGVQKASQDIETKIAQLAEAKTKSQLQALQIASTKMHAQFDQWMQQYAEVLTETAIAATERLVRANLNELPVPTSLKEAGYEESPHQQHLLVRWASEALHSTRSAGRLVLAVHPDLLAELGQRFDELLASPDLPEESCVIPDETLPVGEVVVRQEGGEIRAGLQAQLERLREEIL